MQRPLGELFNPTLKQRQFLETIAKHRFVLYGGAAGGGKSYILRWWLVTYLLALHKAGIDHAQVGLFCEDYPSLMDRHISKIRFEFPQELGQLKLGETRDFVLQEKYGGGRIALRNLDDPSKYQSAEFAAIAVDELTKNKKETFDFLRSRLRWPGVDGPPFAGATNPGGIGHAWVRALWIDKHFPPELQPFAGEFGFVPARASDNPHLTEQYYRDLQSLPPAMAKAFAEGSWDVFAGQVFTEFRESVHVVDPFEMPKWWPRWRAIDWGYKSPACCLWFCREPQGRTYIYRELYATEMLVSDFAHRILEMDAGDEIETCYIDPSVKSRDGSAEQTILEQFRNHFNVHPADNDRLGGWQLIHEMLRVSGRGPGLQIFRNCTNLIRTLPQLVYDQVKVEDCDTECEDHAPDALRYGLKSAHRQDAEKPLELRREEFVGNPVDPKTGQPDWNAIAFRARRFEAIEREASKPIRWK